MNKELRDEFSELIRDRWLNADLTPNPSPKRRGEQRTLTNLYNQRPSWLDLAHKRLDEAFCAAHDWKSDLSDEHRWGTLRGDFGEAAGVSPSALLRECSPALHQMQYGASVAKFGEGEAISRHG